MGEVAIRHAKPSDYGRVIGRVNVWWGGPRHGADAAEALLPALRRHELRRRGRREELVGFLCGFLSQTVADEAYIHFMGVAPDRRGEGLGRSLYERFFDEVRAHGRTSVRCVTSPSNEDSVAFHEALGFVVEQVVEDYDGPGEDRIVLLKRLA